MRATIVTDETATVDAVALDGRLLLAPPDLPAATGWKLKPEGLCRDNVCVPVRDRDRLFVGERLDIAAVAGALGRLAVVDVEAGIAAIGLANDGRRAALHDHEAPQFTLPDLDGVEHDLGEWRGKKKLLFAFASW